MIDEHTDIQAAAEPHVEANIQHGRQAVINRTTGIARAWGHARCPHLAADEPWKIIRPISNQRTNEASWRSAPYCEN
ncbi:hypothetical protein [Bordetella avium]|uniref:hypothetical protein n=2 Tax=Bordetella avium TaxID=521 RepID=UPI000FD6C1F0|nr:hypothetical protein [Bordetella avium]WQE32957.1 hypothetical protein U0029_13820 [Bordetella avium]